MPITQGPVKRTLGTADFGAFPTASGLVGCVLDIADGCYSPGAVYHALLTFLTIVIFMPRSAVLDVRASIHALAKAFWPQNFPKSSSQAGRRPRKIAVPKKEKHVTLLNRNTVHGPYDSGLAPHCGGFSIGFRIVFGIGFHVVFRSGFHVVFRIGVYAVSSIVVKSHP
ncbi:hypothetical protein PG984_010238 [Apiospora sp. TS-2023a]